MSKATDTKVTTEDAKTSDAGNSLTDLDPRNDADITGGCIFCGDDNHKIV
jgi:hypothetical protein